MLIISNSQGQPILQLLAVTPPTFKKRAIADEFNEPPLQEAAQKLRRELREEGGAGQLLNIQHKQDDSSREEQAVMMDDINL